MIPPHTKAIPQTRNPSGVPQAPEGFLVVSLFLKGTQLCREHREHHLGVHLCAQPLDGSFGQPQGTLGLLALVSSFVFEAPHLPQSGTQWLMIAGLAVICTGFGFTLQPVAQSHTTAQRAGLFCALSPACATLLGAAVLREHISVMGMCGIALILLSLLVPQLWQLAEKKGITLLPRHAVPAVRRA